jgi:hypothetical protein
MIVKYNKKNQTIKSNISYIYDITFRIINKYYRINKYG